MKFLILFLVGLGIVIAFPQDAFAAGFCRDVVGWQKSNIVCDIEYIDSGGGGLQKCLYRTESYGTTTYKYPSSGESYGGEYWANAPGTCAGNYVRLTPTLYVGNLLDCRDNGAGKCKLFAKAIDSPNNEQSQKDIVLLDVDYAAPTVSANNASSQWFQSRTTTLSASDTGGSGLVEARYNWDTNTMSAACDNGGTVFTNGAVLTVANGSHRLYLCARDTARNVGNWDSGADQYRVDPIAPEIKSFSINGVSCSSSGPVFCPGTVTVTSSVDITWSASDSGGSGINTAKYEIWRTQDPNNWGQTPHASGVTSPFSETPVAGTYWYGVHASDNTNNCIDETGSHNCGGVSSDILDDRVARGPIKVIFGDQIAPTVSADNASSQWFQSRTTTLSASDTGGSGLAGARYSWDTNAMNSSCASGGTTFTNGAALTVAQGSHTLYLCARDNASNTYSQSFSPYKVDSTAPTIGSFSVSPSGWTNGNITVSFAASDNTGGSGIQEVEVYRAPDNSGNPGTWVNIKDNASSPFLDSPLDGKWWYGIHVTDGAGNCVVESGQNCTPPPSGAPQKAQVDKTPPNPPNPLISPQNNSTVTTENPTYTWTASSDSGSGVASYHIQVDNNQQFNNKEDDRFVTSTTYNSVPNLFHAGYYWHVSAKDNAGNEGSFSPSWFFHLQLNQPPNASFNCTPANCTVYKDTETLTFNNNSSDPDNNISQSQWDILSWGSTPDTTCSGLCNHTLQQGISPNTYTMQLTVVDSAGASDTDTRSFTVRRDIVAGFMCSLDNVNFVVCTSLSGQISQGEILYLKDSSSFSEYTVVSQNATSVTSRTWKINGSGFGSGPNDANPSTAIPTQGTVTLELTARDNQGRSDTQTHTLNPQVPFPEFQEISPF